MATLYLAQDLRHGRKVGLKVVRSELSGEADGSTPAYMTPEPAGDESNLDGRSDLYSLGCVLYETLVGTPPFTGPTVQSVITKRFTEGVGLG
ncbi:MAG TPA: hypothetical protein VGA78_13155 [Gemmatimonadales bacterium]